MSGHRTTIALGRKHLEFLIDAVAREIERHEAVLETARTADDEAKLAEIDYGNDLQLFKGLKSELETARREGLFTSQTFEAWQDSKGVTLSTPLNIADHRARGQLGGDAILLYRIEAATFEEASAIHNLRMGWGPYRPMDDKPHACGKCGAWRYIDCWRCAGRGDEN